MKKIGLFLLLGVSSFVAGVCLPRMSAGKTEGSAFGFYCTE